MAVRTLEAVNLTTSTEKKGKKICEKKIKREKIVYKNHANLPERSEAGGRVL